MFRGHKEWHINYSCLQVINGGCEFITQDGKTHFIAGTWDLIIAHPPCTYLTITGNSWFVEGKYKTKALSRYMDRVEAIRFFMEIAVCNAKKICIENPVGIMSGVYRKPDQIIQPYMFGDPFEKKTCLWLKNLNPLQETNVVEPPERVVFASGKTMAKWYSDARGDSKIRSKTFPGIAKAMAEQWGEQL